MKTYCISDVHGHLDNLNNFIETLNEDDRVFVLGDVVDKGPASIECLLNIMEDDRFIMLLGNHEYMMFNTLSFEPGSYAYNDAFDLWVNYNEGGDTLDQYNALPRHKQLKIFDYFKRLSLCIPNVKVKERNFYLVHSCPHSDIEINMVDVEYNDSIIGLHVWDRVNPLDRLEINNRIVVAGHTPVQAHTESYTDQVQPIFDFKKSTGKNEININNAHYIDIDGGLAANLPNSKLIALCLDDLSYELY